LRAACTTWSCTTAGSPSATCASNRINP
jgi:hypothetical protein